MRTRSRSLAVALVWSCALALPQLAASAAAAEAVRAVEIVGTAFRITTTDGRLLTGSGLIGAVLMLDDPNGSQLWVRIDAVRPDARDPTGETFLYTFMARDPASGAWVNLCAPDTDGLAMGFPLSGVWTASGEYLASDQAFSLTCTSGAIGKCVRMGYRPWQAAQGGAPLRAYHQASVRAWSAPTTAATAWGIRATARRSTSTTASAFRRPMRHRPCASRRPGAPMAPSA
jgi:hypothetical protein